LTFSRRRFPSGCAILLPDVPLNGPSDDPRLDCERWDGLS
jgi:hypothetical protein